METNGMEPKGTEANGAETSGRGTGGTATNNSVKLLTFGILATVFSGVCWIVFGIPLSIAGMILGIMGVAGSRKEMKENPSFGKAPLILSIIGLCVSAVGFGFTVIGLIAIAMLM